MSLLTRYIARQYLLNIGVLLLVLFGFVIAIDVVTNLDRFAGAAEKITEQAIADGASVERGPVRDAVLTALLIVDLWWPRLLQLFNFLIGIVLVAAMGFTCAQLVRQREFVAIMAGGTSLGSLARPFLIVAIALTALQALNQELVIPRIAVLLARSAGDSGSRDLEGFAVRLAPDARGGVLNADHFDPRTNTLEGVVHFARDDAGIVRTVTTGVRAEWTGESWALEAGRSYPPGRKPLATSVSTLPDAPAPTALTVRHLQGFGQNLSWSQIGRMIDDGAIDDGGVQRLERVRWGRVVAMATNLLALLAALPAFLRRMPGPMLVPSLKAAPVAAFGLVGSGLASSIVLPGIPTHVAVFLPAMILAPLAIALHTGVKT